jgi:hypothetical protein
MTFIDWLLVGVANGLLAPFVDVCRFRALEHLKGQNHADILVRLHVRIGEGIQILVLAGRAFGNQSTPD